MGIDEYKYRIEMHAHTSPFSGCSDVTPEEMVKKYKDIGFDGVVITNHFVSWYRGRFGTYEDMAKAYVDEFRKTKELGDAVGLKVIFGMEISMELDHLVYGIDEDYPFVAIKYLDGEFEDFYKEQKDDTKVILHAHPFRGDADEDVPEAVDGIEIFNLHGDANNRISIAADFARKHNYSIASCGTDFHYDPYCGMVCLRTRVLPEDSFELAKILKSGDYMFEISGNVIVPYCASKAVFDAVGIDLDQYGYKVEMHAHTAPATDSASISPEELVDACKAKGYDAVVITNKFNRDTLERGYGLTAEQIADRYMDDINRAAKRGDEVGMTVIPAMEISVDENGNDYLVYGVDRQFVIDQQKYIHTTIKDYYRFAKAYSDNILVIRAHPAREGECEMLTEDIDGIEVLNMHREQNSRIGVAARFAYKNGFPVTAAGSDIHDKGDEGMIAMRCRTLPKTADEFCDIIRSRDYLFDIGGNVVIPYTFRKN